MNAEEAIVCVSAVVSCLQMLTLYDITSAHLRGQHMQRSAAVLFASVGHSVRVSGTQPSPIATAVPHSVVQSIIVYAGFPSIYSPVNYRTLYCEVRHCRHMTCTPMLDVRLAFRLRSTS